MIVQVPMYRLICDFPGCEECAQDGGEFYAWAQPDATEMDAEDGAWHRGAVDLWFCNNHPTAWASDFEGEEGEWDLSAAQFDGDPSSFLVLNDLGGAVESMAFITTKDRVGGLLDRLSRRECDTE